VYYNCVHIIFLKGAQEKNLLTSINLAGNT
jgi:hypothetical protein